MEEQKSTCKRDKKMTQISFGGGNGIGALVVLGGALAVAGLMAVFAIKNRIRRVEGNENSQKPSGRSKELKKNFSCKREDEGSEGPRFLSQTSLPANPYNSCSTRHETSKMSETEVFTKSLILEENPMTEMVRKEKEDSLSGHQEIIILSDDSKPGRIASCEESLSPEIPIEDEKADECGVIQESSSPEIPIEDEKADEAEEIAVEDSAMQSVGEDDKADEACPIVHAVEDSAMQEDACVSEEGDECSEGTGQSSVGSNAEAIWPAELMEESSQEHKQTDSIVQGSMEKPEEEDKTIKIDQEHDYLDSSKNGDAFENEAAEKPITIRKETQEPVMVMHQPSRSSKLRNWILCVFLLVVLMLLLSLTHRNS
ncbi:uncharacterized protein LOC132168808 [Corylus avellana]|uniref:uncharacterized protein LOC132168808 n=1 Tax=Corylus avellana TaxID=13451 RepID=UPI001E2050BA|nr:uncharacterized protein LOC132168808 [Corylus avellana]